VAKVALRPGCLFRRNQRRRKLLSEKFFDMLEIEARYA
jgi:hypothetical protein